MDERMLNVLVDVIIQFQRERDQAREQANRMARMLETSERDAARNEQRRTKDDAPSSAGRYVVRPTDTGWEGCVGYQVWDTVHDKEVTRWMVREDREAAAMGGADDANHVPVEGE